MRTRKGYYIGSAGLSLSPEDDLEDAEEELTD